MFAALDPHERSIQCVLKDDEGKIVKESKLAKDADQILEFLGGTEASVVMESGYNHQYIHDLLKEKGYKATVAHPLMVKAIAHAKVKGDKVDARKLADLLRAGMIPESYVPKKDVREVRDLVRRRHYHVKTRFWFDILILPASFTNSINSIQATLASLSDFRYPYGIMSPA